MSESTPPAPEAPKRKRGRPPLPPHLKAPRKRKPSKNPHVPRNETKIGKARAAAMLSVPDEDIGEAPNAGQEGRPTKYRPEFARVARAMCKLGATDADLAAEFNVCIDTIWQWQATYAPFAKAVAIGKGVGDERVARAYFQRAVGYSYPATKIMQHQGRPVIVPYTEHIPPDPGAAFNWLTNRRPDEWKSRSNIEHSGTITLRDAMNEEQRELDLLKFMAEVRQRRMIDVTPKNSPQAIEHDDGEGGNV